MATVPMPSDREEVHMAFKPGDRTKVQMALEPGDHTKCSRWPPSLVNMQRSRWLSSLVTIQRSRWPLSLVTDHAKCSRWPPSLVNMQRSRWPLHEPGDHTKLPSREKPSDQITDPRVPFLTHVGNWIPLLCPTLTLLQATAGPSLSLSRHPSGTKQDPHSNQITMTRSFPQRRRVDISHGSPTTKTMRMRIRSLTLIPTITRLRKTQQRWG